MGILYRMSDSDTPLKKAVEQTICEMSKKGRALEMDKILSENNDDIAAGREDLLNKIFIGEVYPRGSHDFKGEITQEQQTLLKQRTKEMSHERALAQCEKSIFKTLSGSKSFYAYLENPSDANREAWKKDAKKKDLMKKLKMTPKASPSKSSDTEDASHGFDFENRGGKSKKSRRTKRRSTKRRRINGRKSRRNR